MLKELDDYDWAEVFGEGSGGNCIPIDPETFPGCGVNLSRFSREDVAEIGGMVVGENDTSDWVVWGRLKDGRWFSARGGCDYTGWDCQASNSGNVADTRKNLIRFCLSDAERGRLSLSLAEDN